MRNIGVDVSLGGQIAHQDAYHTQVEGEPRRDLGDRERHTAEVDDVPALEGQGVLRVIAVVGRDHLRLDRDGLGGADPAGGEQERTQRRARLGPTRAFLGKVLAEERADQRGRLGRRLATVLLHGWTEFFSSLMRYGVSTIPARFAN